MYAEPLTKSEKLELFFGLKSGKDYDWKQRWYRFCNRLDLKLDSSIFMCENHFEEQYVKRNVRQPRLIKKRLLVPTIHSVDVPPSCLPTMTKMRKPPTQRIFGKDEFPRGSCCFLQNSTRSYVNTTNHRVY